MATWQQSKSRVPLFHETLWTVLVDPPGGFRYAHLFKTEAEALASPISKKPHALVLPPKVRK